MVVEVSFAIALFAIAYASYYLADAILDIQEGRR